MCVKRTDADAVVLFRRGHAVTASSDGCFSLVLFVAVTSVVPLESDGHPRTSTTCLRPSETG